MSTPWGRRLMAANFGVAILLGLYFWAPRWALVLVVVLALGLVAIWVAGRCRDHEKDA